MKKLLVTCANGRYYINEVEFCEHITNRVHIECRDEEAVPVPVHVRRDMNVN